MSSAAERAYHDLLDAGLIADPGALELDGSFGDRSFVCTLPIPSPNRTGLPDAASFKVLIPARFPRAAVKFTPLGEEPRDFPHQDGQTGALCLSPGRFPAEASARLRAYVENAREWLVDAANDTLLASGQAWELPDFRTDRKDVPSRILYLEDDDTFEKWRGKVGQYGDVQFVQHVSHPALIPVRFGVGGDTVVAPPVSEGFLNRKKTCLGQWLLLPQLTFRRHRPAATYRELAAQCEAAGIEFWPILHRALKAAPLNGHHFLLVGAPIPRLVGDSPSRIHWQAIAVPAASVKRFRGDGKKSRSPGKPQQSLRTRMNELWLGHAVAWSLSESYPSERAEKRGCLDEATRGSRICILGCGAVGSVVAEHLARGGTRELSLFDDEGLDLENLSRHTLGATDVGSIKATALAKRLNGIHPGAHVRGYPLQLPPPPIPTKAERASTIPLERGGVLIDCTGNKDVFAWASRVGRDDGRMVLHLFINPYAKMLTICCSGRHASCQKVARLLFKDIQDGKTPFTWDEYDPDDAGLEILPSVGCWHPTFPARGSDVALMVGAAVPIIEQFVGRKTASRGSAVVLRRFDVDLAKLQGRKANVVEIAWAANYR